MANTGKQNGTKVSLYLDGVAVAHGTSHDISASMATRDKTTKDSAGYEEVGEGLRSMEFSMEGFFAMDATFGFFDLLASIENRSRFAFKYSTEEPGDKRIIGNCYTTEVSRTDPVEDTATFSASFKVDGQWTTQTII